MNTYRQICYHIVFGTRHREPTINESHCRELYAYIHGLIKNKQGHLYRINGIADHIHICSDLHPSVCLADYVKSIKVASSIWMKASGLFPKFVGWQDAYAAFTHAYKDNPRVIDYVKNQKEHHKVESFQDEYRRLLVEHGIQFEERYLL
ncbi:transposase [Cnuella takakiae]|nr:transposase [Cnuella takakiae]OLY94763.1 transposase [Cnuella takakiae]